MEIKDLFTVHNITLQKRMPKNSANNDRGTLVYASFSNIPSIVIGVDRNTNDNKKMLIAGKFIVPAQQTKKFVNYINGNDSAIWFEKRDMSCGNIIAIRKNPEYDFTTESCCSDPYSIETKEFGDYTLVSVNLPKNTFGNQKNCTDSRYADLTCFFYARYPYQLNIQGEISHTAGCVNLLRHIYETDRQYTIDTVFTMLNKHTDQPILKEWCPYIIETILEQTSYSTKIRKDIFMSHAVHYDGFVKQYNQTQYNNKESYLWYASQEKQQDIYDLFGFYNVVELTIPYQFIINEIIEAGFKENKLSIAGCTEASDRLSKIQSMDEYIAAYGSALSSTIQWKYTPKFIPGKDKYSDRLNDICNIMSYNTNIELYPAQKNAVQAMANHLKKNSYGLISAEMGSGKTAIAISTVYAAAKKKNYSAIVMVPASMVLNWQEEINRLAPFSETIVANSITDLNMVKEKILDKKRKRALWVIISSSIAKLNCTFRPALIVASRNMHGREVLSLADLCSVHCPHCGKEFHELNPVEWNDFAKLKKHCPKCGEALYTPYFKNSAHGWVNIKDFGWMHSEHISNILSCIDQWHGYGCGYQYDKQYKALTNYVNSPQECVTNTEYRRYSLALYIKKHLNKLFDFAVFDEVHQLASNSQQGQAFANIASAAKKSIALTGTLSNGCANGLFYYLYRVSPHLMLKHGYKYSDAKKFQEDYGVSQITFRQVISPNGREISRRQKHKILPGVSPLLFTEYLINNSVFLLLEDITKDIVSYNEYPVGIDMDDELKSSYNRITANIETIINKIRSAKLSGVEKSQGNNTTAALHNAITFLYQYLDQPYGLPDVRINNDIIKVDDLNDETIRNKEAKLIELCKKAVDNGEKVLVFCQWTGSLAIVDRLKDILNNEGMRVDIMSSNIKPALRQKYLIDKASSTDIMIMNPRLIEVGLNLLDYTTTIFYELPNIASTVRQSNRRAWRLNQTKPVSVYYLYYNNTVQQDYLSVISQKIKAAENLEGNFNSSGLSEMGESKDIMALVAGNLAQHVHTAIDNNNFTTSEVRYNDAIIARIKKHKESNKRNIATTSNIIKNAFKKRPSVSFPDYAAFI